MLKEHCQIGARVIIVYDGRVPDLKGLIGTIIKTNNDYGAYEIVLDCDGTTKSFGDFSSCDILNIATLNKLQEASSLKEKPCHKCFKDNTVGVLVCWNCASLDP